MEHFNHERKEFTPYGFTCEQWEPRLMNRPDKHSEIELNFFEGGCLTYFFWGERVSIQGGNLALFWAAVPHQIVDFSNLKSYYVITIPLPWVLHWGMPENFSTQILNGRILQETEPSTLVQDKIYLNNGFGTSIRNQRPLMRLFYLK